jgi:hypothetical protein
MPRTYKFQFEVICANDSAQPDLGEVERLIDISMQELVFDDRFVTALDEDTAVTIRVSQIGGTNG